MQLYLVHCGYHDKTIEQGVFEAHVDLFVAAESFDDARARAKALPVFRERKMHIDGVLHVDRVQGHRITLGKKTGDETIVVSSKQSYTALNKG